MSENGSSHGLLATVAKPSTCWGLCLFTMPMLQALMDVMIPSIMCSRHTTHSRTHGCTDETSLMECSSVLT